MRAMMAFLVLGVWAAAATAGEVEIVGATVHKGGGGTYDFSVTLRHGDTGWDHYADKWQVLAPDGTLLGERVLFHPHETEQPFTRSLTGVRIPPGTARVHIRAHDKVHGYANKKFEVTLP